MSKILKFTIAFLLIGSSCQKDDSVTIQETTISNNKYSGIICLVENAQASPSIAFNVPYIDGVKLRLGWSNVEPINNQFDWTLIDAYVAEAQTLNKQLSISIAGGVASPQWLIDLLDSNDFVEVRGNIVPNLWNETYLTEYMEFIEAFGNRYANDEAVSHITISGIGFSNEPVIPPPYGTEVLEVWSLAANQIIETYINSFDNKPLTLPIHTQIPNQDTWLFFKENILELTYQKSETIGLEYHGLDATASPTEGTIADNYYNEIKRISDSRHTGYQFVCSTIENPVCDPAWVNGSSTNTDNLLQRTLEAGIANGADFIEVYANDCSNPSYFDMFKTVSETLKK